MTAERLCSVLEPPAHAASKPSSKQHPTMEYLFMFSCTENAPPGAMRCAPATFDDAALHHPHCPNQPKSMARASQPPPTMAHTDTFAIDGTNISVETRGTGPAILFLHGWPLHRATWRD